MLIDFSKMETTVFRNFYGGEQEMAASIHVDERNRILRGRLAPGASIGRHAHASGSEIIFILSGTGKALYDGGEEAVFPGVCHYCEKGHSHSLINDGTEDLCFYAVVTQQ